MSTTAEHVLADFPHRNWAPAEDSVADAYVQISSDAASCAIPGDRFRCAIANGLNESGWTEVEVWNSVVWARPPTLRGSSRQEPRQRFRLRSREIEDVLVFDKEGEFVPGPIKLHSTKDTRYSLTAKREYKREIDNGERVPEPMPQRRNRGPRGIRRLGGMERS